MKRQVKVLSLLTLILLVLGLGMVGGIVLDRQVLAASASPGPIPAEAAPDFRLITEAWNTIQQDYVDAGATQPITLTYGAISGMVDALGDTGHSRFLSPVMLQEEHRLMQGQLEGIGAEVEMKSGHAVIVAPLDGSPAQQAGLRPGDVILKVNGQDIADLPLFEVVDRIHGPVGSSVTLTILNPTSARVRS